jgi:hypothetical protein
MNMDDIRSDYDEGDFLTLSPGDTVVVEDEIAYIASDWDYEYDMEVTYVWLESAHALEDIDDWYDSWDDDYYDHDLIFEGDLTDEYSSGDEIAITFHVTIVSYYGEDIEVFKEMWDDGDFAPIHPRFITIIKFGPGDDYNMPVFPTIEVRLQDNAINDRLIIKHVQGDPIDWTRYKIIMTNNTDDSSTTMTQLNELGWQTAGESKQINRTISGFNHLNYEKGKTYTLEIYNLKENKRVYNRDNLVCE